MMGYTNESNPFGDSNLTEKFVWKLKNEKEEKVGSRSDSKSDGQRKDEIRVCPHITLHLQSIITTP